MPTYDIAYDFDDKSKDDDSDDKMEFISTLETSNAGLTLEILSLKILIVGELEFSNY